MRHTRSSQSRRCVCHLFRLIAWHVRSLINASRDNGVMFVVMFFLSLQPKYFPSSFSCTWLTAGAAAPQHTTAHLQLLNICQSLGLTAWQFGYFFVVNAPHVPYKHGATFILLWYKVEPTISGRSWNKWSPNVPGPIKKWFRSVQIVTWDESGTNWQRESCWKMWKGLVQVWAPFKKHQRTPLLGSRYSAGLMWC